jgi:hypothetical protein
LLLLLLLLLLVGDGAPAPVEEGGCWSCWRAFSRRSVWDRKSVMLLRERVVWCGVGWCGQEAKKRQCSASCINQRLAHRCSR